MRRFKHKFGAKIQHLNKKLKGKKMNSVTILGNLTKDIEFSYKGKVPLAKACVASNERYQMKDGKIRQQTTFFNLSIKGELAELTKQQLHLSKGQSVIISGKLIQKTYKDKNGKHDYFLLLVRGIELVDKEPLSDEEIDKLVKGQEEFDKEFEKFKESPDDSAEKFGINESGNLMINYDENGKIISAISFEWFEDEGEPLPF